MRTMLLYAALLLAACAQTIPEETMTEQALPDETALATFAGGCFWCMEPPFENAPGVLSVTSGYAGGEEANPTYEEVSSGATGHREAVQVMYDPTRISYRELLDIYWRQIDPTDAEGSFVDRGFQYTSAIFYRTEEEKALAEQGKAAVEERLGKEVATAIEPFTTFYPAEEYHQDYYKENPLRYKYYRGGSGRDDYIEEVWHKDNSSLFGDEATATQVKYMRPTDEEIRKRLTPLQYEVTQEEGTEPAFQNRYWNSKEEGIYVDIVTGEPLFSSKDKYNSGTGWPSFTRPLEPANVETKEDRSFFSTRTEVHSRVGQTHLGHIFPDGPKDRGGLRYCLNSASLRFVPKEKLEEEGYGEYLGLFG